MLGGLEASPWKSLRDQSPERANQRELKPTTNILGNIILSQISTNKSERNSRCLAAQARGTGVLLSIGVVIQSLDAERPSVGKNSIMVAKQHSCITVGG